MITMEHVKKSYKKRGGIFQTSSIEILSDVNLDIQDGDCMGIIGESGSGKSTLARILLGLEAYDRIGHLPCGWAGEHPEGQPLKH